MNTQSDELSGNGTRQNFIDNTQPREIKHVIFLIHGIRDFASWQNEIAKILQKPGEIRVVGTRYGYFNVFKFLAPWKNHFKALQIIKQDYEATRRQYPNAKISVIAHSFGTYLLGKLIKENKTFKFWKVILCGSVLDQNYAWIDHQDQIGAPDDKDLAKYIINDCGDADIWPALARSAGWHYGYAGTHGFSGPSVSNRVFAGNHGLFFDPKFIEKNWKPFLHDDHFPEERIGHGDAQQAGKVSFFIRFIAGLPLNWFFLICFLAVSYIGVFLIGNNVFGLSMWPATTKVSEISISNLVSRFESYNDKPNELNALKKEFENQQFSFRGKITRNGTTEEGIPFFKKKKTRLFGKFEDEGIPRYFSFWITIIGSDEQLKRTIVHKESTTRPSAYFSGKFVDFNENSGVLFFEDGVITKNTVEELPK
tara:strand:- start:564 stop:1832 length:1269 start_codon:yes stop_codon:yes gene_type:complete